jgi:hypothetical protein
MICVWRKVRNGDRTALRAIPVCAPQPICVEVTMLYKKRSAWAERDRCLVVIQKRRQPGEKVFHSSGHGEPPPVQRQKWVSFRQPLDEVSKASYMARPLC